MAKITFDLSGFKELERRTDVLKKNQKELSTKITDDLSQVYLATAIAATPVGEVQISPDGKHRSMSGRFVPVLGKRLTKSFVKGLHVQEKAEAATRKASQNIMKNALDQFLEGWDK